MKACQVLGLPVRLNQGVIAIELYFPFPKAPGLEPRHQMVYCHIQDTRWTVSYPTAEMQSALSIAPVDLACK